MLTQFDLSVKDSETSLIALLLLAREMLLLLTKVDEKTLPRREALLAKVTGKRLFWWILQVLSTRSLGREGSLCNRRWGCLIHRQHSEDYFSLS